MIWIYFEEAFEGAKSNNQTENVVTKWYKMHISPSGGKMYTFKHKYEKCLLVSILLQILRWQCCCLGWNYDSLTNNRNLQTGLLIQKAGFDFREGSQQKPPTHPFDLGLQKVTHK